MNVKEVIRKSIDKVIPRPSSAWERYIQNIQNGTDGNVPVYGQGNRIIFDYYGVNKKRNIEQGRVRIPLQGNESEISYHITLNSDGTFEPIYEGIFPYAG